MKNKFIKLSALSMLGLLAISFLPAQSLASWQTGEGGRTPVGASESFNAVTADPVAKIGSKYYPTIEGALYEAGLSASSSNKISVIVLPNPGTKTQSGSNYYIEPTVYITKNCTIKSYVNLIIPFSLDNVGTPSTSSASTSGTYGIINQATPTSFADSSFANVNTNLKSNIGIANNVTLTIESNAELSIGGIVGYQGQSVTAPVGGVTSSYAQLTMGTNSKIINNGSINGWGYIKEKVLNNGSSIICNNGSNVLLPFVMYDYRGGSYSYAANDKNIMPFNLFDFPNIQVSITYNYGAVLKALVSIYAASSWTVSAVGVVQSSGVFRTSSGASVRLKYSSPHFPFTNNTGAASEIGQLAIYTNGSVTLSSMTIDVGVSVNTSNFYFPINYKQKVIVESGTVTIDSAIKFMRDSYLEVKKGANLTINKSTIFHQNYTIRTTTGGTAKYANQGRGRFIFNGGTLTINASFAGLIETSWDGTGTAPKLVTGSSFNSTNNGNLEGVASSGSSITAYMSTFDTITGYGCGYFDTTSTKYLFQKSQTYTSVGNYWSGSKGSAASEETYEEGTGSSSCLLPNTLVTMADGTQKEVKDIEQGDLVLVFNHETGQLDVAPITFNDHDEASLFTVLYLNFSNCKSVGVISEHGFFDLDTMRYEYIREDNYQEFIGHRFYTEEGDEAVLTSVDVRAEYTECYSPTSFYHFDYFVEGMLSMPGGITGLFNIFEFGSDLKYDEEAYNRDIELYGLFTYEDLAPLGVTEIMFEAYAGKYLKVALGKGILTEEYLAYLIERYGGFTEEP